MARVEEITDETKKNRPSRASFMIDDILSNHARLASAAGKLKKITKYHLAKIQKISPSLFLNCYS